MLLTIALALLCQMCDLHFKFEEDRTKTAVAIESDNYSFGQTDTSTDFILCQCHELHWTNNKKHTRCQLRPYAHKTPLLGRQTNFARGLRSPRQSIMQNFISSGWVISEPLGFENSNLPFVWVAALTIVYALTCYTL